MPPRGSNERFAHYFLMEVSTVEEQQNNNSGAGNANDAAGKTFTQADVDRIVGERLYDAKKKYGDYEELKAKAAQFDEFQEKNKTELEKANEKTAKLEKELEDLKKQGTIAEARAKVSKDTGVPVECLLGEDEETCKAQAEAILKFAKPSGYPGAKKDTPNHTSSSSNNDAMREFAHQFFGTQ